MATESAVNGDWYNTLMAIKDDLLRGLGRTYTIAKWVQATLWDVNNDQHLLDFHPGSSFLAMQRDERSLRNNRVNLHNNKME